MSKEWKKEEVIDYLRESIAELTEESKDSAPVDIHEPIYDMGVDSMKTIQLIVLIEQHFDINFDDEELIMESFSTIDRITDCIVNKLRS
ncbi:acyl carrier protein [Cohnella endophytica]|nr:acyl carrier protein [Cohnella endophytica]